MVDRPDPARLAAADEAVQLDVLVEAALADPVIVEILDRLVRLDLPDAALMAGAVYQAVWNRLTGRPPGHGINDYDIGYHDATDPSESAEAAVIARCAAAFDGLDATIEVRNQARVHIWFSAKFGVDRVPLADTTDALRAFASPCHAVALRPARRGDRPAVLAPLGVADLFAARVRPSLDHADPQGWNRKVARQRQAWPELDFQAFP